MVLVIEIGIFRIRLSVGWVRNPDRRALAIPPPPAMDWRSEVLDGTAAVVVLRQPSLAWLYAIDSIYVSSWRAVHRGRWLVLNTLGMDPKRNTRWMGFDL